MRALRKDTAKALNNSFNYVINNSLNIFNITYIDLNNIKIHSYKKDYNENVIGTIIYNININDFITLLNKIEGEQNA